MLRAGTLIRAEDLSSGGHAAPFDHAVLDHEERRLRRKVIELAHGDRVMVDLPEAVQLRHGDALVLDDGRHAGIVAAEEELLEVKARDAVHLAELAWHIGNRHLAARIEPSRILILRDHVLKAMLEGLGARVEDVVGPFEPLGGAYSGHGHAAGGHSHGHGGDYHRASR